MSQLASASQICGRPHDLLFSFYLLQFRSYGSHPASSSALCVCNLHCTLNWLTVINSFPTRVMLVLDTVSAVPMVIYDVLYVTNAHVSQSVKNYAPLLLWPAPWHSLGTLHFLKIIKQLLTFPIPSIAVEQYGHQTAHCTLMEPATSLITQGRSVGGELKYFSFPCMICATFVAVVRGWLNLCRPVHYSFHGIFCESSPVSSGSGQGLHCHTTLFLNLSQHVMISMSLAGILEAAWLESSDRLNMFWELGRSIWWSRDFL